MDVLTGVLSSMKLSGGVFLEAEFSAPWCVASQMQPGDCLPWFARPAHVIAYHYVVSGKLLCAVGEEPPVEICEGQIFILPRNQRHLLGSRIAGSPVDSHALIEPAEEGGRMRIAWGGGGEKTSICCGFLGTLTPIDAFLLSLPNLLVVDVKDGPAGDWLASSLRVAPAAMADAPDMIGRLAELLLLEGVKQYLATLPPEETGWLAGLRDPYVSRALTALHGDCARAWTSEALAAEAGLSRSAFADRFTRLMGEPPMRYLARHRMNAAANLLQEGRHNACNIAYTVGFNSEAAFSRAFKKEFGVPPGAWQREKCG